MAKERAESNARMLALVSAALKEADKRKQDGAVYGEVTLKVSYAGGYIRDVRFEEASIMRADEV